MKVKIYTYNFTSNYGAILQAFSLGNFIHRSFKSEISFSSYHPYKFRYYEFIRPMFSKKPGKLFGHLKKNIEVLFWRNNHLNLLKNAAIDNSNNNSYSIYGSDEIWNFLNPYYGFSEYFFGKDGYGKKIAYAVSIGKATFEDLNNDQKNKLEKLLGEFHSISVRDDNSAEFVYKLLGIIPEIVVDPTLLSNPEFFNSSKDIKNKKKYALVYGLNFTNKEIDLIKKFCEKNELDLISVGYFNSWIKNNRIGLSPSKFYEYIKKSSYVFTSMFHGIILSIKSNKSFWYTLDPIRKYKVRFIISKFQLENRNLSNIEELEGDISYEKINKSLDLWVKKSQEFLINSINK